MDFDRTKNIPIFPIVMKLTYIYFSMQFKFYE